MAPFCPKHYEGAMPSRKGGFKLPRKLIIKYSIIRYVTTAPCEKRKPLQEAR